MHHSVSDWSWSSRKIAGRGSKTAGFAANFSRWSWLSPWRFLPQVTVGLHPIIVYHPSSNPQPTAPFHHHPLLSLPMKTPPPTSPASVPLIHPRRPRQPGPPPVSGRLHRLRLRCSQPPDVNMAEGAFGTKSMKRRNIRNLSLHALPVRPPRRHGQEHLGDALEIGRRVPPRPAVRGPHCLAELARQQWHCQQGPAHKPPRPSWPARLVGPPPATDPRADSAGHPRVDTKPEVRRQIVRELQIMHECTCPATSFPSSAPS